MTTTVRMHGISASPGIAIGPARVIDRQKIKTPRLRIAAAQVDTEKERELAAVFGIQSIPAFLFVPQEGRPTMSNGIAQTDEETKAMFKQMIDELLLGKDS